MQGEAIECLPQSRIVGIYKDAAICLSFFQRHVQDIGPLRGFLRLEGIFSYLEHQVLQVLNWASTILYALLLSQSKSMIKQSRAHFLLMPSLPAPPISMRECLSVTCEHIEPRKVLALLVVREYRDVMR